VLGPGGSITVSRYRTFRIADGQLNAKGVARNNDLVRMKIETEIRKTLMEKGLEAAAQRLDVKVRFTLTAPRRNGPAGPAAPGE
jgi:hypothetical protein